MKKLQQVRHQSGLSQKELAKRAGVARMTVIRIERGEVSPTVATLYKLAAVLGVDPWMLADPPSEVNLVTQQ